MFVSGRRYTNIRKPVYCLYENFLKKLGHKIDGILKPRVTRYTHGLLTPKITPNFHSPEKGKASKLNE